MMSGLQELMQGPWVKFTLKDLGEVPSNSSPNSENFVILKDIGRTSTKLD